MARRNPTASDEIFELLAEKIESTKGQTVTCADLISAEWPSDSAMAELQRGAQLLRAEDPKLNMQQAFCLAVQRMPRAYERYVRESGLY